ncbi:valine--tRNA ligase [Pseudoxanthomonas wuyuanensis]|uniref:Valine--tRNA ligase n=1 Tax=Pseudoxanthomonas wuyuanensis TaxID=1073196 RepID=A0A286DC24_9GAMM|nr:valine--tRNA ligase [Pseudoxanthomonas wuyuanensis]KAF1716577.1 valine--tRNA ligase [Pseudoxanthomonas wuyuanensis]SOD56207.1 valyl-tRNA synthetase [Pseudoxanthomonas wuyuanensis]
MSLAPSYDPKSFESRLYAQWENAGHFKPTGKGESYSILLPPPNVTGTLHMGHAFQHTLMDALVRYHRMRGYDTLWQMGSDHAGIATEMVVSRNLAQEGNGETRDSLGREGFIGKVWEWKAQSGDIIERQMRRLGASGDWSRSTFTMDPQPSQAVIEAFVRLYEEGLIYRGQRLVNWDPVLKTAISDLEVENVEEDGFLWSIRYPLADDLTYEHVERDADGNEVLREIRDYLVVATTRPETMLGDAAVAVHPEDERYARLIGKTVKLPLAGREIPIIADTYVERDFGTGVVKITPAHDFNDYEVWTRHKDEELKGLLSGGLINIFTPEAKIIGDEGTTSYGSVTSSAMEALDAGIRDGSVIESIPAKYRGLDRYEARKAVLADLEDLGLLVETKPHKLQVPKGDRTGQVIEPYLTDQWFVKMDALAKRGMELVEGVDGKPGAVKFVPPNWINTYRHWMENIQDWCISRQLWWGHRIPAWFDEAGNCYVARSEEEAYAQAAAKSGGSRPALHQDNDVLETWFSSQLWPFSTLGWPNEQAMAERGFDRYLPSSVLVTGFDIIFFWVARMIMATDHFTGKIPFKDVYITGLIRDKDGQKMSKSKGNVLDPLDIIDGIALEDLVAKRTSGLMQPKMAEKIAKATRKEFPDGIIAHGADALRFTIAALATHGRDIKFDLGRAEGYKNFCNKLWNATRFVLMNTEARDPGPGTRDSGKHLPVTDAEKWILARLAKVSVEAEAHFAQYRFDLLAQSLYEFAWNEFCDWFVELAKPALNGDDPAAANSTRHTLLHVLESLLRLLHPLIPFVTEELWQQIAPRLGIAAPTISLQAYPTAADFTGQDYARAETDVEWLKSMVSALRRVRSELNVSPSRTVPLLLQDGDEKDRARVERFAPSLSFLLKLESIRWLGAAETAPASATAVIAGGGPGPALQLLVPLEGLVDLDAERVRLDKEIKRVEAEIGKCNGKLGNATFVQNAPPAVVEQERARLADWNTQLTALREQRGKL